MKHMRYFTIFLLFINVLWIFSVNAQSVGQTKRVSVATGGAQANAESREFRDLGISNDGNYIVFESNASNLVPNDTNSTSDIFLYDQKLEITTRVSVATGNIQANGQSSDPAISLNGRYIIFSSLASNLVIDDTNGVWDVFLYDIQTFEVERVSVSTSNVEANGPSFDGVISADGRYVIFTSGANNLVGDDTNGLWDVFLFDRQMEVTTRISIATGNIEGNNYSYSDCCTAISSNGRYIAFESDATNLVLNDTNGMMDIFIHDSQLVETTRISVATGNIQANGASSSPSMTGDGRYVVFASYANNLVVDDLNGTSDIFIHDRQTGETSQISAQSDSLTLLGNDLSYAPSISTEGRYVTFISFSTNFVDDTNGLPDIFVRDRIDLITNRISFATDNSQSNGVSSAPNISGDGRYVAFASSATNLVANDTNGVADIFVHQLIMLPPTSTIAHSVDEQSFYGYMHDNYVPSNIRTIISDFRPDGIYATVQFTDGVISTVKIVFAEENGILKLTLENVVFETSYTAEHELWIYQQLLPIFMATFDYSIWAFLYPEITDVTLTDLTIEFVTIGYDVNMVVATGDFQSELGCPTFMFFSGNWAPDCVLSRLEDYDGDGIYTKTIYGIPQGSWETKIAYNGTWEENYGVDGERDGANIPFEVPEDGVGMLFSYDSTSHILTITPPYMIVVAAGDFQSELGCPIDIGDFGDWAPECWLSRLTDPDEDGIYTWTTTAIGVGDWEMKIALNSTWDENYGLNGEPGGANIPFNVPTVGAEVIFSYNSITHEIIITVN